jgi:hypothetical protein
MRPFSERAGFNRQQQTLDIDITPRIRIWDR